MQSPDKTETALQAHQTPSRQKVTGSFYERLGSFTIPTDENELRELFGTFDADGSGTIEREEFIKAMIDFEAQMGLNMSPATVRKSFEKYDMSHDGRMTFEEFQIYMLNRARQ